MCNDGVGGGGGVGVGWGGGVAPGGHRQVLFSLAHDQMETHHKLLKEKTRRRISG